MAMELMFSESPSKGLSPRISFSHDLCQADVIRIEQLPPSLDSSSSLDFNFQVHDGLDQDDSSSADELFSHGKLLPAEIKKKNFSPKQKDQSHLLPPHKTTTPQCDYEQIPKRENSKEDSYETQKSKSFWGFKRSSSLNCGSGYGRSLCPLPLLSRSNSTGSATSVKKSSSPSSSKDGTNQKQNSHYQKNYVGNYQKPPLKKSYGNYGNGVHVNPVLNVHSASLFGLGSFFTNSKDKSRKK